MAFTQWKELEVRIRLSETIDERTDKWNLRKWKDFLTRLVDIIRFLVKTICLRGHREGMEDKNDTGRNDSKNRGNFLELVEFLSKYDPVLKEHLFQIKMNDKIIVSCLAPLIQNEFITILGENVKKKIFDQVKREKYFDDL